MVPIETYIAARNAQLVEIEKNGDDYLLKLARFDPQTGTRISPEIVSISSAIPQLEIIRLTELISRWQVLVEDLIAANNGEPLPTPPLTVEQRLEALEAAFTEHLAGGA